MDNNVYRQLQIHLDKSPVPFPETESGVEIRLLKQLFNEEEAGIALKLSAIPETIDRIHERFDRGEISPEKLESILDGLAQKGAVMGLKDEENGPRYSKIPMAIGMFEYQVDRITREFAEDFYRYEEEGFADALLKSKTGQMRTIPVNVSIDPEFTVGNYDNIRAIIEKSPGPYAVMNCVCRQSKELMGEPCKQTDIMQTCFTLERGATYMMGLGVAEEISKEEMISRVTLAEKEGMVLQPANNQNPGFICCCCGCCCGVLTAAKKYKNPSELLHSNYYAAIDAEECTACGDCIEICQMDALSASDPATVVLENRCIGCGVCVNTCAMEAISLRQKEKIQAPPVDGRDMYKRMIIERYGIRGAVQFLGKAALGKKI